MSHTCTPTLIVVSEGRNRTIEWNVKWPAIRAWGQYHSRILDRWAANAGRSEGATAVKAVPFLCAARRSLSSRSVHVASCSCLALQLECIVEFCSLSYMSESPSRTRRRCEAPVCRAPLSSVGTTPAGAVCHKRPNKRFSTVSQKKMPSTRLPRHQHPEILKLPPWSVLQSNSSRLI